MSEKVDPQLDAIRLAEAAAWRIYLTEIDATTTVELEAWLDDPENSKAWVRVCHPLNYLRLHMHEPKMIAVRSVALGSAGRAAATGNRAGSRKLVSRRLAMSSIAGVVLVGIGSLAASRWLWRPDEYETARGERRTIALIDGSKIDLDASTRVTVRYSGNSRQLHLIRGQAYFTVAHDPQRPFSVRVKNHEVIATGTAFNIDLSAKKMLVSLLEGHVVVLRKDARDTGTEGGDPGWSRMIKLKAGQQLTTTPSAAPKVGTVDRWRATAWMSGRVVFENETLSSVVARVNRYSIIQVVVSDPKIGAMRISGALNAGDVDGFVDLLTRYLPLRAATTEGGDITLEGLQKKA